MIEQAFCLLGWSAENFFWWDARAFDFEAEGSFVGRPRNLSNINVVFVEILSEYRIKTSTKLNYELIMTGSLWVARVTASNRSTTKSIHKFLNIFVAETTLLSIKATNNFVREKGKESPACEVPHAEQWLRKLYAGTLNTFLQLFIYRKGFFSSSLSLIRCEHRAWPVHFVE